MKEYRFPLPDHIEKNMWPTITFVLYVYMFFGGHARRDAFIEKMLEIGMTSKNARNLWNNGTRVSKEHMHLHPYISFTHTDYVSIKSHHQWSKVNVTISDEDLSKIKTVTDMKRFIIWLEAGKPRVTEKINKDINSKEFKELFCRSYHSISLNGLAKKFHISWKTAMCVIMKQAMEQFGWEKTNRFVTHSGYIARISNIYNTWKVYRANKKSALFKKEPSDKLMNQKADSTPVYSPSKDGKSSKDDQANRGRKTYAGVSLWKSVWKRNLNIDKKMPWLPWEDYMNFYKYMFSMHEEF